MRKSSKCKKSTVYNQNKNSKVTLSKISKYNTFENEKVEKVSSPIIKKYKFVPTLAFKHI